MQITKSQKHFFTINLDSQNQVIVLFLFFHKSNIAIYIDHILNHFSFNIKDTKQTYFATWLFLSKLFKTNKKHTTNQTSIFTPNYEVLIPHGYVGKGHSSFQINNFF